MTGTFNAADSERKFAQVEEGDHKLEVVSVDKGLKEGDLSVKLCVVGEPKKTINFYTISFSKEWGWQAVEFLKAIGEPCTGEFEWDSSRWPKRRLGAKVKRKDSKTDPTKSFPTIAYVYPLEEFKAYNEELAEGNPF